MNFRGQGHLIAALTWRSIAFFSAINVLDQERCDAESAPKQAGGTIAIEYWNRADSRWDIGGEDAIRLIQTAFE